MSRNRNFLSITKFYAYYATKINVKEKLNNFNILHLENDQHLD